MGTALDIAAYQSGRLFQALRPGETDLLRSFPGIAFACGFSSSRHFASVFRQLTGKTPRASRKRV